MSDRSKAAAPPHSLYPSKAELEAAFRLIRKGRVPSVPEVVTALRQELDKPEPNSRKVGDLLAQDPAIAGQVLKMLRSPLYGLDSPPESTHHAVAMLGFAAIRNLIATYVIQGLLLSDNPLLKRVWENMMEEARAAVAVSRHVEGVSPDEAYLFGIMHDVGNLLFAAQLDDYEDIWELHALMPLSMIKREQQRYGTEHGAVGFLLAKHWQLPEHLCLATYHHHTPHCSSLPDPAVRTLVALIQVANYLTSIPILESETMEMVQYRIGARNELMIPDQVWGDLQREARIGFWW